MTETIPLGLSEEQTQPLSGKLSVNSTIQMKETGGPTPQKMARIGEEWFGIEHYIDTSGFDFKEGVFYWCPWHYDRYLTYQTAKSVTGNGALGIVCVPCWGAEASCKCLAQWSSVFASCFEACANMA
jgi:hypothetical protein